MHKNGFLILDTRRGAVLAMVVRRGEDGPIGQSKSGHQLDGTVFR